MSKPILLYSFTNTQGCLKSAQLPIYPIPAAQELYVKLPANTGYSKASITDLNGRDVRSNTTTNPTEATFNVSSLAKGVYIVGIQGKKVAKRIIVQ